MDSLFDAMGHLFGSKFSHQWGIYDDGSWLAELSHLGARHIELGLARLRQQVRDAAKSGDEAWPPQPVAFAGLCEPRPEDVGLPTVDAAWREVCAHCHAPGEWRWSHEAVQMAGQTVGWRDIHSATAQSVRIRLERRFEREYGALVNRVMAGQPLQSRGLIENDATRNRAELAERASRELAQQQAEAAGLPHRMSAGQGLAMLKAATGRA
ncbi:replication protein P [Salinicola sp. LHM]|uniref:replication protein P n=1 Tax=Salinicola sp. LHM TaxID=3065298 RepID=UPI002ACF0927|nr:replication protein P [Salinicola sp. LHM]WQH34005.1 replication protein P [Salinicola sp. LHM]